MAAYDLDQVHRYVTSAALGNIQKYTDRDQYELIFVDANPAAETWTNYKYHKIDIDKRIELETDPGISACRNIGAKAAEANEYICFIDNDVFVPEGWLPKLIEVMHKRNARYIFPHQGYTDREFIKQSYLEELPGQDDAGLILMTREAFDTCGGWDERFGSVYHELGLRRRLGKHDIRGFCTNQVLITHISGITTFPSPKFDEWYTKEGSEINEPI